MKEQVRQADLKIEESMKDKKELENKCNLMAQLMTSLDIENDT